MISSSSVSRTSSDSNVRGSVSSSAIGSGSVKRKELTVLKNASSLVRNVVGTEATQSIIHQNSVVGVSCILLMVISLPMFYNGDIQFGLVSLCIGIGSFMADYVNANDLKSKWHDIDRLICVLGFLFNHGPFVVHYCFRGNYVWGMLYPLLVCGVPLSWSRRSQSKNQWIYRHSTFHVFIAFAVSPLFLKARAIPYMKGYMTFVPFYCFIVDPVIQKVFILLSWDRRFSQTGTTRDKSSIAKKATKRELAVINQ